MYILVVSETFVVHAINTFIHSSIHSCIHPTSDDNGLLEYVLRKPFNVKACILTEPLPFTVEPANNSFVERELRFQQAGHRVSQSEFDLFAVND